MKRFRVDATFPEVAAAHAQQSATVHAGSWSAAVSRAAFQLKRKVRGRRITTVELRIVKLPDEPNGDK